MNKLLICTIGAVAMGLSAPASAADMAARPYTKAPPPAVAALYDWSGFYIRINGGGGPPHQGWGLLPPPARGFLRGRWPKGKGGARRGPNGHPLPSPHLGVGLGGQG